jgi:hypothetical protein
MNCKIPEKPEVANFDVVSFNVSCDQEVKKEVQEKKEVPCVTKKGIGGGGGAYTVEPLITDTLINGHLQ